MMLRVDIYPLNHKETAPKQTLHCCLSTCVSAQQFLSVGRKDADVILSNDKCVSRRHLTLRLVSNQEYESVEGKPVPDKSSTPEETAACEGADDGLAVFLKDSSKFGTYLVTDPKHLETDDARDEKGDATGDDETDDEDAVPSQKLQQVATKLSTVARRLLPDGKLVQLEGEVHIKSLSHRNARAVIQCGQNGSTLVLTRVSLGVRIPRAVKDPWVQRAPSMGMTLYDKVSEDVTYVVCKSRITSAQTLVAWCLQKPMVAPGFLDSLWNRSKPNEPLPDPSNYPPEAGDEETFWNKRPNPRLWSHLTLLSHTHDEDMEALCTAAGASVVPLYGAKNAIALADEYCSNHDGCFYLSSSKQTKIVKHLKKKLIPHVTQKSIALYISKQEPLQDTRGQVIGTPGQRDAEGVDAVEPHASAEEATPAVFLPDPETIEKADGSSQHEETQLDRGTQVQSSSGWIDAASQKPSRKRTTEDTHVEPAAEQYTQSKRARSDVPQEEAEDKTDSRQRSSFGGWTNIRTCPLPVEEEKVTEATDEERVQVTNVAKFGKREKLSKTKDGWLIKATSGDRKAFMATEAEILDSLGDFADLVPPKAETDVISDLVIKAKGQIKGSRRENNKSGVKDFKRFRKNAVIRVGEKSRIEMRVVLSKQSDRQLELQEEQAQLEASLREADALFQDRSSTSSISRHFKPRSGSRKV